MKKKYLYNGKYYTEEQINGFASESGMSFSDYIGELGDRLKSFDAPYEYNGKHFTENEMAGFAKQSKLPLDDYLSEIGLKKKEPFSLAPNQDTKKQLSYLYGGESSEDGALYGGTPESNSEVQSQSNAKNQDNALDPVKSALATFRQQYDVAQKQFDPLRNRSVPDQTRTNVLPVGVRNKQFDESEFNTKKTNEKVAGDNLQSATVQIHKLLSNVKNAKDVLENIKTNNGGVIPGDNETGIIAKQTSDKFDAANKGNVLVNKVANSGSFEDFVRQYSNAPINSGQDLEDRTFEVITDPNVEEAFRRNPEKWKMYLNTRNNTNNLLPEHTKQRLSSQIAHWMDMTDKGGGLYKGEYAKEDLDALIENKFKLGDISAVDRAFYYQNIKPGDVPTTAIANVFGRNYEQALRNSFLGRAVSKAGLLENPVEKYKYEPHVSPEGLLGKGVELGGQLTPMMLTSPILRAAGFSEKAANIISAVNQFGGTNEDKANELFPDDPAKKWAYTILGTGIDALATELPIFKSGAFKKEAKNIAGVLADKTVKQSIKEKAKKSFLNRVDGFIADAAKNTAHGAGVLTGINTLHQFADIAADAPNAVENLKHTNLVSEFLNNAKSYALLGGVQSAGKLLPEQKQSTEPTNDITEHEPDKNKSLFFQHGQDATGINAGRGSAEGGANHVEASLPLAADERLGIGNHSQPEAQGNRIEQHAKDKDPWTDNTTQSVQSKAVVEEGGVNTELAKQSENVKETLGLSDKDADVLSLIYNAKLTPEEKKILYRQWKRGVMSMNDIKKMTTIDLEKVANGGIDKWAKVLLAKNEGKKIDAEEIDFEEVTPPPIKAVVSDGDKQLKDVENDIFYTGRGKKFDDLKETKGDYIFFSKDPKDVEKEMNARISEIENPKKEIKINSSDKKAVIEKINKVGNPKVGDVLNIDSVKWTVNKAEKRTVFEKGEYKDTDGYRINISTENGKNESIYTDTNEFIKHEKTLSDIQKVNEIKDEYDQKAEAVVSKGDNLALEDVDVSENDIQDKFKQGYGKVSVPKMSENGDIFYEDFKNPDMTRSERDKRGRYRFDYPKEWEAEGKKRKEQYGKKVLESETNNPRISNKELAGELINRLGGKVTHESKSGSIYIELPSGETVRVSDHEVGQFDENQQSNRQLGTTQNQRGRKDDFNFSEGGYREKDIDNIEKNIRENSGYAESLNPKEPSSNTLSGMGEGVGDKENLVTLNHELEKQLPNTLPPTEKQGSLAGGENNAAATTITGAIHSAIEETGTGSKKLSPDQVRQKEENIHPNIIEKTPEGKASEGNPRISGNERLQVAGDRTEPPIEPPKENEPIEVNDEGGKMSGITHADTAEVREKLGLPEYDKGEGNTHESLLADADKRIVKNPNIANEIMGKYKAGGKMTPEDNAVLARYKSSLDFELEKNPTKETYDRINELIKVLEPSGREAGQLLESRKLLSPQEDNLSNFLIDKQTAQGAPLTEKQVKDESAKYEELKKANEDLQKQLQQEREQHAKDIAELGLNKARAKAKRESKKTAEEYQRERKNIVEAARKALEKIRKDPNIKATIPLAAELKVIAPFVKDYLQSLSGQALDKLDVAISDIHAEFKDVLDGLTKRDVFDILAGEYDEPRQNETRNEKANKIRLLKREVQLLKELEAARKGEEGAKSEIKKREQTVRIEGLKKKITEVRKLNKERNNELPFDFTPDEEVNIKEQIKLNKRAEALEKDLREKNYLKEPEPQKPFIRSRKTQQAQDRVIDLENKIRHERSVDEYNKRGKGRKVFDKVMEFLGIRRLVQTAVDTSVPFRQGATLLSPRQIDVWAKGFDANMRSVFSPKKFERIMYGIRHDPVYHDMVKDMIVFNDLGAADPNLHNEDFRKSFIYEIPIISEPLKASNRSADAFLNVARYEMYKKLRARLEAQGLTRESDPQAFKYMGNWVMSMTGRGRMMDFLENPAANTVLGNTFYGARLMASRFNMLNPLTYFDTRIPMAVRKEAIKDITAWVGTTMAIGAALSYTTGGKISLNPDDSDFLQLRYGKKVYDISGGLATYIRTFLRITKAGYTKVTETKYKGKKATEKAGMSTLNFFRNKLSPNTSYAVDAFFGKAYGQEFDPAEIYQIYPMYGDDVVKAWKEDGVISLATVGIPNLVGIGYGSYASKGQIDATLEDLKERNLRSDEMNSETIKNYKQGGRPVTFKEFNDYADKRDKEIEKDLEVLYKKGVGGTSYEKLSPEQVKDEVQYIKSRATSKVKEEMFGKQKKTSAQLRAEHKLQKEREQKYKNN